jgi:hypothetical protein
VLPQTGEVYDTPPIADYQLALIPTDWSSICPLNAALPTKKARQSAELHLTNTLWLFTISIQLSVLLQCSSNESSVVFFMV